MTKDTNKATKPEPTEKAPSRRNIYIAVSREEFAAIEAAARRNCRSFGGELVYAWRTLNAAAGK